MSSQQKDKPALVTQGVRTGGTSGAPSVAWIEDHRLSLTVLLLLTTATLYVAYIVFRPFLTAIFLAFVLTIAFNPLHEFVRGRLHGANAAAIVTTMVIMLCILLPLILISLKVLTEAASLYTSLAPNLTSGGAWYDSISGFSDVLQRAAERTGIPVAQLRSAVTGRAQEAGAWLVSMASSAARGAVQQMVTAILVFLVLFFLLRDREEFRRGIFGMLPLPPRRVLELTTTVHETITANIYGMFAVGIVQGVLTALGFWFTGLRAPLFCGVLAMVFSFVPLVGPILVWAPGCLILAAQAEWLKAAFLLLWGGVLISAADYVIRPKFGGGSVKVNRLLILLSFLGGVKAFGAIGIFVGPVMLSLVVALFRILREEYAGGKKVGTLAS